MSEPSIVAQGYDAVYEAMPHSPTLLRIWKSIVAGTDFPDDFYHISFVTLADLRKLASALNLSAGDKFCDAACGMGGPGLWVAQETSAHVYGVDISRVAVAHAGKRAGDLGMTASATFSAASLAETGLPSGSMDAVMSLDGLQYAPNKGAAIGEFARILRRGGRLAFTAFELDPERTKGVPVVSEDPVADYRPLLAEHNFKVLTYEQTPNWHQRVVDAYTALTLAHDDLLREMGPLATAAFMTEMTLTLERDFYSGRVFAVAERT